MAQMPAVGTELQITGVVKVTSVNQSASEGQEEERRVGMQITMLRVGSDSKENT